jgi:hypothetical protein
MNTLIRNCKLLLTAYREGKLGHSAMPEDANPGFTDQELRLAYFTLPMSLNYQRDSYTLWKSALATHNDTGTKDVFSVKNSAAMDEDILRKKLVKYKIALQPNKHIATWRRLSQTITTHWGSITELIAAADNDYLKLKELIQFKHKKEFPYLSGPKIFNYWSFIIMTYGKVPLKNAEFIEIAPDTHVTKCSVLLGIITEDEALKLSKDQISLRWREALHGSGITPIEMHPPLWFWSRNNFLYKIPKY